MKCSVRPAGGESGWSEHVARNPIGGRDSESYSRSGRPIIRRRAVSRSSDQTISLERSGRVKRAHFDSGIDARIAADAGPPSGSLARMIRRTRQEVLFRISRKSCTRMAWPRCARSSWRKGTLRRTRSGLLLLHQVDSETSSVTGCSTWMRH